MADEEKVAWTVAAYCDTVLRRSLALIEKENRISLKWNRPLALQFSTKVEAWQFCVDRSRAAAEKAEAEADKAQRHFRKCWKRLKQAKEETLAGPQNS